MSTTFSRRMAVGIGCALAATVSIAEPVTYEVDPRHTYPSFEADHNGGLSIWRGKIERSSGTIVLDREAQTGTVDMTMDMDSINFGLDAMTAHAKRDDILDVERYPTATYTGRLTKFKKNGDPTAVEGEFTLHGVTRPLDLQINHLQCQPNASGGEVCGANASGTFNRDEFGVDFNKQNGFLMYVNLVIDVEANRVDPES